MCRKSGADFSRKKGNGMNRKSKPEQSVRVGKYIIFGAVVVIEGVPGEEGNGYTGWTESGTYLRITVGLDGTWGRCLETVMHEVIEFSMILCHAGFQPLRLLKRVDAEMYRYAFTHEQYTEIIQNAADALQYVIPELEKKYKQWNQ